MSFLKRFKKKPLPAMVEVGGQKIMKVPGLENYHARITEGKDRIVGVLEYYSNDRFEALGYGFGTTLDEVVKGMIEAAHMHKRATEASIDRP